LIPTIRNGCRKSHPGDDFILSSRLKATNGCRLPDLPLGRTPALASIQGNQARVDIASYGGNTAGQGGGTMESAFYQNCGLKAISPPWEEELPIVTILSIRSFLKIKARMAVDSIK
jgi:hypothetical protein